VLPDAQFPPNLAYPLLRDRCQGIANALKVIPVLTNLRIPRFAEFEMRLKIKNEKVATLTVSNAKVSRNSPENFSGYSC
jgi:hypothetical protein